MTAIAALLLAASTWLAEASLTIVYDPVPVIEAFGPYRADDPAEQAAAVACAVYASKPELHGAVLDVRLSYWEPTPGGAMVPQRFHQETVTGCKTKL